MRTQRKVIVSGSAGGIGSAVVARLRAGGDIVIGIDCRDAEIIADLSTPAGRHDAIAAATEFCAGTVDAVVTCAGLVTGGERLIIEVNYFGSVELLQGFRPLLERSQAPRALAVSSAAVLNEIIELSVTACLAGDSAGAAAALAENPGSAYATSKYALSQWIRRTAGLQQWAGRGILLNAIAPGTVVTAMTRPILESEEGREMLREFTPIAVQDFASPQDLAPFIAFMIDPDNRYILGQTLFCDGGTELLRRPENRF